MNKLLSCHYALISTTEISSPLVPLIATFSPGEILKISGSFAGIKILLAVAVGFAPNKIWTAALEQILTYSDYEPKAADWVDVVPLKAIIWTVVGLNP